ncbi:MAG: orotidine-5'-phosphate decarboxylase [Chloroflexi bacterium]|nr:orotidine-5'-phosphate decarboxylase [Chloroflexota bacterium]
MTTFAARLDQACSANRSLVCVGLDVDPDRLPISDVLEFNRAIIDATADLVCAYKPNLGFYEALGLPGLKALEGTVEHIRNTAPGVIIIGDAKRGDIGSTARAYAKAMFQVWGFDVVTVNAWGGQDTLEPYLEDPEHGVFIWCRGSNPGSADLQDLEVVSPAGNVPLYRHLAQVATTWNRNDNVGLVMGATSPEQLAGIRDVCGDMPLLIPGVGAQGGDLEAAVRLGTDRQGRRAVINSSRGILYASSGPDFAQAARRETAALRDAINQVLEAEGKGWP